jgi:hypothetical protein
LRLVDNLDLHAFKTIAVQGRKTNALIEALRLGLEPII